MTSKPSEMPSFGDTVLILGLLRGVKDWVLPFDARVDILVENDYKQRLLSARTTLIVLLAVETVGILGSASNLVQLGTSSLLAAAVITTALGLISNQTVERFFSQSGHRALWTSDMGRYVLALPLRLTTASICLWMLWATAFLLPIASFKGLMLSVVTASALIAGVIAPLSAVGRLVSSGTNVSNDKNLSPRGMLAAWMFRAAGVEGSQHEMPASEFLNNASSMSLLAKLNRLDSFYLSPIFFQVVSMLFSGNLMDQAQHIDRNMEQKGHRYVEEEPLRSPQPRRNERRSSAVTIRGCNGDSCDDANHKTSTSNDSDDSKEGDEVHSLHSIHILPFKTMRGRRQSSVSTLHTDPFPEDTTTVTPRESFTKEPLCPVADDTSVSDSSSDEQRSRHPQPHVHARRESLTSPRGRPSMGVVAETK